MNEEEILGRSTIQVATSILENTPYTEGESRATFISVWNTCNRAFDIVAQLAQDPNTPENIRKLVEPLYHRTPTDWNIPLEVRVPPSARSPDIYRKHQRAAKKDGRKPIVVPGYEKSDWNAPQKPSSLEENELE